MSQEFSLHQSRLFSVYKFKPVVLANNGNFYVMFEPTQESVFNLQDEYISYYMGFVVLPLWLLRTVSPKLYFKLYKRAVKYNALYSAFSSSKYYCTKLFYVKPFSINLQIDEFADILKSIRNVLPKWDLKEILKELYGVLSYHQLSAIFEDKIIKAPLLKVLYQSYIYPNFIKNGSVALFISSPPVKHLPVLDKKDISWLYEKSFIKRTIIKSKKLSLKLGVINKGDLYIYCPLIYSLEEFLQVFSFYYETYTLPLYNMMLSDIVISKFMQRSLRKNLDLRIDLITDNHCKWFPDFQGEQYIIGGTYGS